MPVTLKQLKDILVSMEIHDPKWMDKVFLEIYPDSHHEDQVVIRFLETSPDARP